MRILVRHAIESRYEYTAGVALSIFLDGLRRGKIFSSRCRECGRSRIPPSAFCVRCFSSKIRYVSLEGEGYMDSFTESKMWSDGRKKERSIIWIFVKFQGVEGGIIHRLKDCSRPFRGMKVRPVFRKERAGSILDVEYFAPSVKPPRQTRTS